MSRRAERPLVLRSRSRLRKSPRPGASERSEVAPGAGNEKEAGGPRQSARSVCLPTARSSASCLRGRAERPRVSAVAKPAASPEERQSERSEVCRDRAKEKYNMPEGRAGRRAAVVRRVPEAKKSPCRAPFRARPSEARSRRVRGGYKVQSRRAKAVLPRSASPPMARRLMGEPLGAEGRRRGSLAAAARSAAPQVDAAVGWAGDGWRDACTPARGMTACPA